MKDSRIGTYGVIGILVYVMLLFFCLYSLPPLTAVIVIFAGDPFSKMVASQIISMMPYARTESEAKAKVVYRRPPLKSGIGLAIQGLLPVLALYLWSSHNGILLHWEYLVFAPCVVMYFLYRLIWHRLQGYTGDCCGALFLLIELSFYLSVVASSNI